MYLNRFGTYVYLNGDFLPSDASLSAQALHVYGSLNELLFFPPPKRFFSDESL